MRLSCYQSHGKYWVCGNTDFLFVVNCTVLLCSEFLVPKMGYFRFWDKRVYPEYSTQYWLSPLVTELHGMRVSNGFDVW